MNTTVAYGAVVALITAFSPVLRAQVERVEIRPETPAQSPVPARSVHTQMPPSGLIESSVMMQNNKLGDRPDFVPTEEVRDEHGNVVEVRQVGNPYTLAFTNGDYTPPRGIDPALKKVLLTRPSGHTFGFVMLRGRMSFEKQQALRDVGVEILGVHTYQSLKCKIPAKALGALDGFDFVQWVGYARPTQKIDHNLAPVLAKAKDGDLLSIIVVPFEKDTGPNTKVLIDGKNEQFDVDGAFGATGTTTRVIPNGPIHKRLVAAGFDFRHYNEITHTFFGKATKKLVMQLLQEDWVHVVELDPGIPKVDGSRSTTRANPAPMPLPVPHDQGIPMVQQDSIRRTWNGRGVPAGFIDTGMDSTPLHRDFSGKALVWFNNAATPYHMHGTHVAGTIWGNGTADIRYQGAAPGAGSGGLTNRLFIGDLRTRLSTNVTRFRTNYTSGSSTTPYPRIVSNSYSSKSPNGYNGTEDAARTIDTTTFFFKHLWCFSAGNTQGVANMWCGSPSSAKNCLTIANLSDKFDVYRKENPGRLISSSRWGVTDGRVKPEVGAPGDLLTSCLWNTTNQYANAGGTSMSTPMVSGCLISKLHRHSAFRERPEALKAVAIAGAKWRNRTIISNYRAPQTGKPLTPEAGWGMINANAITGSSSRFLNYVLVNSSTNELRRTGQGHYFDITLPADAYTGRLVLCYTELAASSSATRARVNDVRAYLDTETLSTATNTGEYQAFSGNSNVIVRDNIPLGARRGKKVRVKVHASSVRLGPVRWCVCLMVYRKNPTVTPSITTTGPAFVKTNTSYTLGASMFSDSAEGEFQGGRMSYDGAFSIQSMSRRTYDSILHSYLSTNRHKSFPWPSVGKGLARGMTVGSGASRQLNFFLRSPSTGGWYTLSVKGTYMTASNPAPELRSQRTVCVDGSAPQLVAGVASTTHTPGQWHNSTLLRVQWNAARDVGCAGIQGVGTGLSLSPSAIPTVTNLSSTATSQAFRLGQTSTGYYFTVRSRDRAGNWSAVRRIGPFRIDTLRPAVTGVSINGGATRTDKLAVSVTTNHTDTRSGVAQIRYSGDQRTWTGWINVSSTTRTTHPVNLASMGATDVRGTKSCFVQVRDRAGNVSLLASDSIFYDPKPVITPNPSLTQFNLTKSYYLLRGKHLTGVNQVTFGGTSLRPWSATHEDDWWYGRYRVVNDTTLHVYPPQNRAPGNYTIQARNSVGLGNGVSVRVRALPSRTLLSTSVQSATRPHFGGIARGDQPDVPVVIVVSLQRGPSTIGGLVKIDIGNNWSHFLLSPFLTFNRATGNAASVGTAGARARGFTLYFQGVYFHPTARPLPTSNVWTTRYR